MKIILCENYDEMSAKAAEIFAEQIKSKPDSILGLATGSTPIGMYNILAEMNQKGDLDFSSIKSFNLDEYYKIAPEDDQSYHYFMNENLFSKINIKPENINILDGLTDNPVEECANYDKRIKESGGIDLQILGIGQNGHIAFNEPDESLHVGTHLTDLTESTINANSRFFESIEDVPTQALTMGIGSILSAKKIVILANGESKRDAVSELFNDEIKTSNPASLLKLHPDVVLICDKAAYQN